ncbi:hypothetical protein cypCar_00044342 [Cyprinus carpio]|nr:hypothetical protein cypCar_00044342 [Cyprinus carpio]
MHCPTTLEVNGKETEFPLPEPGLPLNFSNSTGLRYEAEDVRRCLLKGLKESIKMSLTEVMDEPRRQVVAVAARDLKHAQEFAQRHSVPRAYGSYEDLAKDPEIDVVYVGTIHPHHLSVGVLFMNAQKNVLCEKPLAMNLKEVQELIASAQKNHVFLMEAVWTRFFPVSVEISRLLSRGEVGEVKVVRAEFGAPLTHVPRAVRKDLGGGALLDIGVYCLQFVLMVFNGEKPESIQATGVCLDTE